MFAELRGAGPRYEQYSLPAAPAAPIIHPEEQLHHTTVRFASTLGHKAKET